MFSCGRNCLSYRIKFQASTSQTPPKSAPLLFLYPTWYREHVRKLHHAATAAETDSGSRQGRETAVAQERTASDHRAHGARADDPATSRNHGDDTAHQRSERFSAFSRSLSRQLRATRKSVPPRSPETLVSARGRRKADHEEAIESETGQLGGSLFDLSQLSNGTFRKFTGRTRAQNGLGETSEAYPQHLDKRARKQRYQPARRTWEVPLKDLAKQTQQSRPMVGEVLEMDRQTIYELTGHLGENVWTHHVRSGCEVHILPPAGSRTNRRHVLLRGESRARELTKDYLLHFRRNQTKAVRATGSDNRELSKVRICQSRLKSRIGVKSYESATHFPMPDIWTIRSFADYVTRIVHMRIPRTFRQELYRPKLGLNSANTSRTEVNAPHLTHNQSVALILEGLFVDAETSPFISTRALQDAMSFASQHTELSSTLFMLYKIARGSGLSLPVEIFNIVIDYALKYKPHHTFRDILRDMAAMDVMPNGKTWAKLLAVVTDQDARRHILAYVHSSSLLDSRDIVDAIAIQLVRADFLDFARRDGGLEEFFEAMDDLLGVSWISSRVITTMLRASAKGGHWDIATTVTKISLERGVRFTSSSLNHLIKLTQRRGYLRTSLDILQSNFAQNVGWDDSVIVPTIFTTAWKRGFFNVCRVLWQYAATHGIISFGMQNAVRTSLISNLGLDESLARRTMYSMAGKLVMISDTNAANYKDVFPVLSSKLGGSSPLHWLLRWTPTDGTRDEQLSLASVTMHQNLTAWKTYHRMETGYFFNLLEESFDRDYSWRIHNIVFTQSPAALLEQAINIQLVPTDNAHGRAFIKPVLATPPLLPAPEEKPTRATLVSEDIQLNAPKEGTTKKSTYSVLSHRYRLFLGRCSVWRRTTLDSMNVSSAIQSYQLVHQVLQLRCLTTQISADKAEICLLSNRATHHTLQGQDPETREKGSDSCEHHSDPEGEYPSNRGVATSSPRARNPDPQSNVASPRKSAEQASWKREPPWREILPLHRDASQRKTEASPGPSFWRLPKIRLIEESPFVRTRIERLRLRSAFITWNTSEAHLDVIRMQDWRKMRMAVSRRGPVTRKWYRVGHLSLLLSHIKEIYTSYAKVKPRPMVVTQTQNWREKAYIRHNNLEEVEDLAALKYACAMLSQRSREIYEDLLLNPNIQNRSFKMRRRMALQTKNMQRLESLIEPFFDDWVALGKLGDVPDVRAAWPKFEGFRRSLTLREFLGEEPIVEWKQVELDLDEVNQKPASEDPVMF